MKTCPECGRTEPVTTWRKFRWGRMCNPCYKRLQWRPMANGALDRDRASSRDAKRRRRAAGERI